MQFERRRADAPGGVIEYLVGGDGPPLLCLHAASGVRINPATEALARHRQLFLPIAPGFDGAPTIDGVESVPALADRIAGLVDATFGGAVDLAGHSFGGWTACWLAATHPHLVRRLVLQCPAGLNLRTADALEGDPATFLSRAFAHPEKRRPETKAPETVSANRAQAARYAAGVSYDTDLIGRMRDIVCQTLILYGRKDGVIPPETPLLLKQNVPHSHLIYVEDAAHNIEIDQPEAFVDAVLTFLSERNASQDRIATNG